MFKGVTQLAWVGENGEVIKEKGFLGISLEKTTRDRALFDLPVESSQDLTMVVSVPSNVPINNAETLTRLEAEISGIPSDYIRLDGGRQSLKGNLLIIKKESLPDATTDYDVTELKEPQIKFLEPTPFIESNHPKIRNLVKKIVAADETPFKKTIKLVDWINKNIAKRPVISVPDALAVIENCAGDCNEHAVLLAALARAAGIPAKLEAGLVYLNGRFYYHAWNLLYLGKWITVDSLFGQLPADVTHIRFSSGELGQQLDLISMIGKIKLKIIKQTK
jgi:transglutaminase-like putative cysteine protease